MGTWGEGILSDDRVRDVHREYLDLFNRGNAPEAIRRKILGDYAKELTDTDEGPLIWFAVAKAQWDCGHLQPTVLVKVRQIVGEGLGLDRWSEQGERLLQKRKKAVAQFLAMLASPNPRPRRPKKATKRKPIFEPGDCLAVRLEDNDWGAILVLQGPLESDDPYIETYGINLAVTLRYKSSALPTLSVFEKREWLRETHHSWRGKMDLCNVMAVRFKKVKDRFVRVGNIPLRYSDPSKSESYSSWPNMTRSMYLQDRWDRGIRD